MSKYSNEFKLQVVKYCIEQHHGSTDKNTPNINSPMMLE